VSDKCYTCSAISVDAQVLRVADSLRCARCRASRRWLGRHARAHTPLLDICGSCRAPQQRSMIDLQAVSTYVYNTCRVLTDRVFYLPISVLSRSLSGCLENYPASSSIIRNATLVFERGLLFITYVSPPAVSCPPSLPFNLIDTILYFVWDL